MEGGAPITSCRAIRWVYWDPKFRYNALEFGNRVGEPADIVSQVPIWFHRILSGRAHHTLAGRPDIMLYDLQYWFGRLVTSYVPNPVHPYDLWHAIDWRLSTYDELYTLKGPLIWYDCIHWEVRVGDNFHYAKKKSVAEFRDMPENKAVDWLNQGFRIQRQSVQVNADLRHELRRSDGYRF